MNASPAASECCLFSQRFIQTLRGEAFVRTRRRIRTALPTKSLKRTLSVIAGAYILTEGESQVY